MTRRMIAAGTEERLRGSTISVIICLVFLLSGCSAVESIALRASVPAEDYQEYAALRDSGQLDQDGQYIVPQLDEAGELEPGESGIHVTFAKNAYLDIPYYLDPELKQEASEDECTLQPGDCLYYDPKNIVCDHPHTLNYGFDRFAVFEYTGDGKRGKELSWGVENAEPGVVLRIPEDYEGTELSVVPLGRYENRTLEFSDYYIDGSDQQRELTGTWIVNDEQITKSSMDISITESLYVDYRYDPEEFAFVSSDPASFYHDKGLVRFEVTDALDGVERYCVELRSLEGTFLFDPSQFPVSNGSVEFQYNGRVLKEPRYIPDGGVISYTAIPDENYVHAVGSGQITVNASEPDETLKELKKAVEFLPDKMVRVILPRPAGGTVEYSVDGVVQEGSECMLRTGTVISMRFTPWNGWICHAMDGGHYTVGDPEAQIASANGLDFNSELFEESDGHKPTLNLVMTESVKDVLVDISNGEAQVIDTSLSYGSGNKTTIISDWLGQNNRLVFSEKVGTYPNIALTFKEDTILNGYALKLDILLKDSRGNTSHSVRYVTKLPAKETIELYDAQALIQSNTVYETVTVTASKVEIVPYQEKSVEHAVVTAVPADVDDPVALHDGDGLEASRDVTITITPEEGYYISGSDNSTGIYTQTLKYAKWEKDFQDILEKHPVKKLWYVTLVTEDDHGDCVYRLDGEEVSGRVSVREGQKLTLEYTITDPNYRIVRGTFLRLFENFFSSDKAQCDIPVAETLDGQTVRRADYISVEKKEG